MSTTQQRTFHLDIEIVNVKFHRACLDREMAGLHLTGPMPNMNQGMLSQQQQHQLQHQAQQHQLQQQQLLQAGNPQQQQQQQQQSVMNAVNQPANPNSAADHQKLDHIAKVKNLLWPLKESLAVILFIHYDLY